MEIDYDSTALTFSDIYWSSELDQFAIESNLINGRLSLAGAGSTPDVHPTTSFRYPNQPKNHSTDFST